MKKQFQRAGCRAVAFVSSGRVLASAMLCALVLGMPNLAAENLRFDEAARIVVQSGGRKKPLDTFAAESLQTISGRRSLKDPQTGRRIGSMDALLSMWFGGRNWNDFPVVLVSDANLKRALGLPTTERLFPFGTFVQSVAFREIEDGIRSKRARNEDLNRMEKEAEAVFTRMRLLNDIVSGEALKIVPSADDPKAAWVSIAKGDAASAGQGSGELSGLLGRVSASYLSEDARGFDSNALELRSRLERAATGVYPTPGAIGRELHYNRLHPFRWAWMLYLASLVALWMRRSIRGGLVIFGAGLAMHLYGFGLRCWVAGRAPVTNMYESIVWVSLGVAGLAFAFGLIYRAKVYLGTAAPLAVLGLILADSLPSVFNASIGPLPPVLRDNFWLVTHVLSIALGYAALALAMGLGHVTLGLSLLKPASLSEQSQIHQLLYRALQVGVLLLAVGTILGGVWANYSWGRFWGWDPKETWALIALLLYIFALHGRLAGWWGNFGLSVAAAVCFNGVLMAWYGVNFVLGTGLHSYGFGGGGVEWVAGLVAFDLLFIAVCVAAHLKKGGLHPNISKTVVRSRPSSGTLRPASLTGGD